MTYPRGTFVRNSATQRVNHWITAACFVLLMISGLAMFHPMLFFLNSVFGGGQWMRVAGGLRVEAALVDDPRVGDVGGVVAHPRRVCCPQ